MSYYLDQLKSAINYQSKEYHIPDIVLLTENTEIPTNIDHLNSNDLHKKSLDEVQSLKDFFLRRRPSN